MKLITKDIEKATPALYTNDGKAPEDVKVTAKLFTPWANWTWFLTEMDPETGMCFGMVHGHEKELGYFDLNELKALEGPVGLKVERDRFFGPATLEDVMEGRAS